MERINPQAQDALAAVQDVAAVPAAPNNAGEPVAAQPHANIEDVMPDNLELLAQWADFKARCHSQPHPLGHAADLREFGDRDRYECDPLTKMAMYDTGGIPVPKLPRGIGFVRVLLGTTYQSSCTTG